MLGKVVISFQHNCEKAKALKLKMCYNCYSHGNHYDDANIHHCIHGDFKFLHVAFLKCCRPSHFKVSGIFLAVEQMNKQLTLSADPWSTHCE